MAHTIQFNLRNNQMCDVTVSVFDNRTNTQVLDTVPLNHGEMVGVEVVADSSGKGASHWTFYSSDGSVNSSKQQTGISDGDEWKFG